MQSAENPKRKLVNLINPWYTTYKYRSLVGAFPSSRRNKIRAKLFFHRPAPFGPGFLSYDFFAVPYGVCMAAWNIKNLYHYGVVIKCLNN